ncbi:MAG: hypothetical protein ACHP65_10370, partial [Legionellales bacterium]
IYFLPTAVFKTLLQHMETKENNNHTFIKHYLDVVKLIIESENTISKELPSKKLLDITSGYKRIIDLAAEDLIESKSGYFVGHYCTRYKVKNHAEWTLLVIDEINNQTQQEKIVKNYLEAHHSCNNPQYISTLSQAKINAPGAILAEFDELYNSANKKYRQNLTDQERNKKFSLRIVKIVSFINKRFIKKGTFVNRVFNSFCQLSSTTRKYVTFNKAYFTELDIKNCQPLFLALFLLQNNLAIDESYIQAVSNGCFYEAIQNKAKELNIESETIIEKNKEDKKLNKISLSFSSREETKILTYRSVFFTTKTMNSPTVEIFSELYPLTYNSITQYIKKNKIEMAGILQNAEANLILNIIPDCPYFTVHDAIYVLDEQEAIRTRDIILNKTEELSNGRLMAEIKIKSPTPVPNITSNNEINYLTITANRKPELAPRKPKNDKIMKFNRFKELITIKPKQEIMLDLNISERTYTNYKRELSCIAA